jgi:hypothetical protein
VIAYDAVVQYPPAPPPPPYASPPPPPDPTTRYSTLVTPLGDVQFIVPGVLLKITILYEPFVILY